MTTTDADTDDLRAVREDGHHDLRTARERETTMSTRSRLTRTVSLFAVLAFVLAACGGDGEGEAEPTEEDSATEQAEEETTEPTDGETEATGSETTEATGDGEEVTLSFIWFEWPPAQILEDFANENYPNENVTIEVETVPLAQWHDAIFTEFAAGQTSFDIPILDSQFIGEAVTGGHVVDMTEFAQENIDLDAYPPNLLAAYGQYPRPVSGEYSPDAPIVGVPLLADTWVLAYRKDLMNSPPDSWEGMLEAARACEEENPDMNGLAFHGSGDGDVAAVTLNTVIWVNGGEIWNPEEEQIEGVINDETGQEAIQQLVNDMVPLAPDNVGTAFISEINAAMSQGTACMGMNWVAGLEGIQDPANSTLGDTEEEVLENLGFAPLPCGETCSKPLGGMGMHISAYTEDQQAALDFIEWFSTPEAQVAFAEAGGVPTTQGALDSEEFQSARPWNPAFAESVPDMRDFWNLPEYARLLEIHTANANAAITGVKEPVAALNDLAAEEQEVLDTGGGL